MSAVAALTPDQLENISYQLNHTGDNRGPEILAINVVLFVLAAIAVILRIYSRRIAKVPLKWDDFIIVGDLFLMLALVILNFFLVHYGMGRHAVVVGVYGVRNYLRGLWAYQILYTLTLPTIKLSILIFYTRIFETPRFKLWARLTGAFIVLWTVAFIITDFLVCIPFDYYWNQVLGAKGHCFNYTKWANAGAYINIITDVVILALPTPMIWKLRVSRNQKIALSGVFLLGSFVLFASIIRVPYLRKVITADTTWTSTNASIWTIIETATALICACLPILRPLMLHYFGKPFRSWSQRSNSNSSERKQSENASSSKWSWGGRNSKPSMNYGSVDGPGISGRGGRGVPAVHNKEGSWTHLQPHDQSLTNDIEAGNKFSDMKGFDKDLERGGLPSQSITVKNEIEWSERG